MIVFMIIVGLLSLFALIVSLRVERKLIHNAQYSRSIKSRLELLESKVNRGDPQCR